MKRIATFLLSLLSIVTTAELQAQWHQLQITSSNVYNKLSFPSDDTGFVIGAKIYRTIDGGLSFDSVTSPAFTQYTSIDFRTGNEGVITGLTSVGKVARTFDRGSSWNNVTPLNMLGTPVYAEFHSPVKGTLLTSAPVVYHTADGGTTWDTTMFGYDYFNSVSFPDSITGYIGGFDGTFAYRGVIMKTIDGGVTWNPITTFTQWNTDIAQLDFVDADTGFAIFTDYGNTSRMMRTVDGAVSWDTVIFNFGHLVDINFLDHNLGYALNDSGTVFRTLNAGTTWTIDYHPMGYFVDACVTPHYAFACGPGLLYRRDWLSSIQENVLTPYGRLYPNPAAELLHLDIPDLQRGDKLILQDMHGNALRAYVVTDEKTEAIELDGLKPGGYVVLNTRTSASYTFIKK